MNVGEKVSYLPGEFHTLSQDRQGHYCFEWFWTQGKSSGQELTDDDLQQAAPKKLNNKYVWGNRLVGIKPGKPKHGWKATVMACHEDGSADLDIEDPRGGVMLSYFGVKHDETKTQLHSFS